VRAQVDRDLTTVDYFDRLLGLIKNLGHHISHHGWQSAVVQPEEVGVTPAFPKKTKCVTICMPGSSFMHMVTYK
jgi:hypothetical protein